MDNKSIVVLFIIGLIWCGEGENPHVLTFHDLVLALCWYRDKNRLQNGNGLNFLWSSTESSSVTAAPSCTENQFKFKSYFAAVQYCGLYRCVLGFV